MAEFQGGPMAGFGGAQGALVVAAGGEWESRALAVMDPRRDLTVLKRCVDVADAMAAATAGQAKVAVIDAHAPGLDLAAVEHFNRHGLRVVAVVPGPRGNVRDAAMAHLARIGVVSAVGTDDIARLPEEILAALRPREVAGSGEGAIDGERGAPEIEGSGGLIVAVWGPAGAPGRSTVAAGLASTLAHRGQQVTLIDADPMGGSLAAAWGVLDEAAGVLAAARLRSAGVLRERLNDVMREVSPGLRLISGLPRADRWSEVRSGVVEEVAEWSALGSQVIIDVGQCLEHDPTAELSGRSPRHAMTHGALAVADEIVAVGLPDPIGIARLARGLVELDELGLAANVRVVLNRNRESMAWSPNKLEALLAEVAEVNGLTYLPADQAAVDRALAAGRPVDESSDLGAGLAGLVEQLWPQTAGLVKPRRVKRARRW